MDEGSMFDEFEEQAEKDLQLHVAKIFEHMEWESELPEPEKNRRRFAKYVVGLPRAIALGAQSGCWWVAIGQLERVVFYAKELFGQNCLEEAAAKRHLEFEAEFGDEESEEWKDGH